MSMEDRVTGSNPCPFGHVMQYACGHSTVEQRRDTTMIVMNVALAFRLEKSNTVTQATAVHGSMTRGAKKFEDPTW